MIDWPTALLLVGFFGMVNLVVGIVIGRWTRGADHDQTG